MNTRYLLIVLAATLGGCASVPDTVKQDWPLPAAQAKYVVPAGAFTGLKEQDVIAKYFNGIKQTTDYRLAYRVEGETIGVTVEPTNEGVKVGYVRHVSESMHHDYFATFSVKTAKNDKEVILDVTCPQVLVQDNKNFLREWPSLISIDKARMDIAKICRETPLVFNKRENGEVNVNYGDSAVYANFARKLQAVKWGADEVRKDDIAKYRWFEVPDGNVTRKLGITVYPYRNGSKVTYVWERNVICKANAGCNYDPGSAKRISDTIASIAND